MVIIGPNPATLTVKRVVCRYNENIDWIDKSVRPITIYNKGDKLDIENVIEIQNIGRENYVYFKYIVNNYDNLTEYTIFQQAKSLDHCKTFFEKTNSIDKIRESDLKLYSDILRDDDQYGNPTHPGLPIGELSYYLFGKTFIKYRFYPGEHCSVHKDRILFRSKEFYEKCIEKIETCNRGRHGFERAFERLIPIIFDGKTQDLFTK